MNENGTHTHTCGTVHPLATRWDGTLFVCNLDSGHPSDHEAPEGDGKSRVAWEGPSAERVRAPDGCTVGATQHVPNYVGHWRGEAWLALTVYRKDHVQAHRSQGEAEHWLIGQHALYTT